MFKDNLISLRKMNSLSQEELAEKIGVSRQTLSKYETGESVPDIEKSKALADVFGTDIVDVQTGALDRSLLAQRAFASAEGRQLLEDIELPFIRERLFSLLDALGGEEGMAVVEVPLLDRLDDDLRRADEIVYVHTPREIRRERAIQRGMSGEDFDARDAAQPSEEYLFSHACTVLDNSGSPSDLARATLAWWSSRTGKNL